jgi:NAD(P)-dependent dehydrogenase (short-subunit alcohol dehydrogenase family)
MNQEILLSGQVAVVTGGGRGIGREIARQLAAAGAEVVVTARTTDQLDATRRMIEEAGGLCHTHAMDVLDKEQVESTLRLVEKELGSIDILVNNAGISGSRGKHPWEFDVDDWWRVQEVNVRGPFICSRAVIPGMIKRGGGRIIMVGSHIAFYPLPDAAAYSVSKAALTRLTDNLAEALKDHGVSVFVISPGLVKTEMTKDIPDDFAQAAGWTPIEKSGELCVRLATGDADLLTGRYIHASMHDLDELISRASEITSNDTQAMRFVE